MKKIGYFVPEFPGQTHSFFWREMKKLRQYGVDPEVVSTRRPASRIISHAWSVEAMEKTTYLFPPACSDLLQAAVFLFVAGPRAWFRAMKVVWAAEGVSWKQRARLLPMMLLGARLAQIARQRGWSHLHVHSCADAANVALFANRFGGLAYSLTLHGPLEDYGPNQKQKWNHSEFAIVITRLLLKQANERLGGSVPAKLSIAPMGVDLENFQRETEYEPWRGEGEFRLFSCGRINRCKGHEFLIRALSILRQRGVPATLQIAGAIDSDDEQYFEELKQIIEEERLQDCVEMLGAVSEEVVRETLSDAHVFSLASLHEPLGVVYMEAMAMSVPVVTTNSGGVSELVVDGKQGLLVPPEAHEALADALEQLANNPEAAIEFGESGRNVVESGFHSGVSARTIAEHLGCAVLEPPQSISCNEVDKTFPAITSKSL